MNIKAITIKTVLLTTMLLINGCSLYQSDAAISCDMSKPKPVKQSELHKLVESALAGSAQDAISLHSYYFRLNNLNQTKYWAMIAAENGNAIGQRNYGTLLVEYGNNQEKSRGHFWLVVAKRCGNDQPPTESH